MTNELRYPIGMQTFSQIIEEGYAYVDKTGYVQMHFSRNERVHFRWRVE